MQNSAMHAWSLFIAVLLAWPAAAQDRKEPASPIALSCTMETPESYRNHVVAVTVAADGKSASVNGRRANEVTVEYLRYVILEDKIRWVIDRGTGRFSMFTTGGPVPELYGKGSCLLITKRKF